MITSFVIATCIVAIAGSVKLTAFEYSRFRTDRQLCQALRLALITHAHRASAARENIIEPGRRLQTGVAPASTPLSRRAVLARMPELSHS